MQNAFARRLQGRTYLSTVHYCHEVSQAALQKHKLGAGSNNVRFTYEYLLDKLPDEKQSTGTGEMQSTVGSTTTTGRQRLRLFFQVLDYVNKNVFALSPKQMEIVCDNYLVAALKLIFGADLLANVGYILNHFKIDEIFEDIIVMMKRRGGKSVATAVFLACMVCSQIDCNANVFGVSKRVTKMMKNLTLRVVTSIIDSGVGGRLSLGVSNAESFSVKTKYATEIIANFYPCNPDMSKDEEERSELLSSNDEAIMVDTAESSIDVKLRRYARMVEEHPGTPDGDDGGQEENERKQMQLLAEKAGDLVGVSLTDRLQAAEELDRLVRAQSLTERQRRQLDSHHEEEESAEIEEDAAEGLRIPSVQTMPRWKKQITKFYNVAKRVAKKERQKVYSKNVPVKKKKGDAASAEVGPAPLLHKKGDKMYKPGSGEPLMETGPEALDFARQEEKSIELLRAQWALNAYMFTWLGYSPLVTPSDWRPKESVMRLEWKDGGLDTDADAYFPVVYLTMAIEKDTRLNDHDVTIVVYVLDPKAPTPDAITPVPLVRKEYVDLEILFDHVRKVKSADLVYSLASRVPFTEESIGSAINFLNRDFAFFFEFPPDVTNLKAHKDEFAGFPQSGLFGAFESDLDRMEYNRRRGVQIKWIRTPDVDYFPHEIDNNEWILLPIHEKLEPFVLSPRVDDTRITDAKEIFYKERKGDELADDNNAEGDAIIPEPKGAKNEEKKKNRYDPGERSIMGIYEALAKKEDVEITRRGGPRRTLFGIYDEIIKLMDKNVDGGIDRTTDAGEDIYVKKMKATQREKYIPLNQGELMDRLGIWTSDVNVQDDDDIAGVNGHEHTMLARRALQFYIRGVPYEVIRDVDSLGEVKVGPTFPSDLDLDATRILMDANFAKLRTMKSESFSSVSEFAAKLTIALADMSYYDFHRGVKYSDAAHAKIRAVLDPPPSESSIAEERVLIGEVFEEYVQEYYAAAVDMCLSYYCMTHIADSEYDVLSEWHKGNHGNKAIYYRLVLRPIYAMHRAVSTQMLLKRLVESAKYLETRNNAVASFIRESVVDDRQSTTGKSKPVFDDGAILIAVKRFAPFRAARKEAEASQALKENSDLPAGPRYGKPMSEDIDELEEDDDSDAAWTPQVKEALREFIGTESPLLLMLQRADESESFFQGDPAPDDIITFMAEALDFEMLAYRMHFRLLMDAPFGDTQFVNLLKSIDGAINARGKLTAAMVAETTRMTIWDEIRHRDGNDGATRLVLLENRNRGYVREALFKRNPETHKPDIVYSVWDNVDSPPREVWLGAEERLEDRLENLDAALDELQGTEQITRFYVTSKPSERIHSPGGFAVMRYQTSSIHAQFSSTTAVQNTVTVTGGPEGRDETQFETGLIVLPIPLTHVKGVVKMNYAAFTVKSFSDALILGEPQVQMYRQNFAERVGEYSAQDADKAVPPPAPKRKGLEATQLELLELRYKGIIKLRLIQGAYVGAAYKRLEPEFKAWLSNFFLPRASSVLTALLPEGTSLVIADLAPKIVSRYIRSLTEENYAFRGMENVIDDEESSGSVAPKETRNSAHYAFACEPDRFKKFLPEAIDRVVPLEREDGELHTGIPGIDAYEGTPRPISYQVKLNDGPVALPTENTTPQPFETQFQILALSLASSASFSGAEWMRGGRRVLLSTPLELAKKDSTDDVKKWLTNEPLAVKRSMPTLTVFLLDDDVLRNGRALIAEIRPAGALYGYPTAVVHTSPAFGDADVAREPAKKWISSILEMTGLPGDTFILKPSAPPAAPRGLLDRLAGSAVEPYKVGTRSTDYFDLVNYEEIYLFEAANALVGLHYDLANVANRLISEKIPNAPLIIDVNRPSEDQVRGMTVYMHEVLAAIPMIQSSFEYDPRAHVGSSLLRTYLRPPAPRIGDVTLRAGKRTLLELINARERRSLGMVQELREGEQYTIVDNTDRKRIGRGKLWGTVVSQAPIPSAAERSALHQEAHEQLVMSEAKRGKRKSKKKNSSRGRSKSRGRSSSRGKSGSRSRSGSKGKKGKSKSRSRSRSGSKGKKSKSKSRSRSRNRSNSKGSKPAKSRGRSASKGKTGSRSSSRSSSKGSKGKPSKSRGRSTSRGSSGSSKSKGKASKSRGRSTSKGKSKSGSRSSSKDKASKRKSDGGSKSSKGRSSSVDSDKKKKKTRDRSQSRGRKENKAATGSETTGKSSSKNKSRSKSEDRTSKQKKRDDKSPSRSSSRDSSPSSKEKPKRGSSKDKSKGRKDKPKKPKSEKKDKSRSRSPSADRSGGGSFSAPETRTTTVVLNPTLVVPGGGGGGMGYGQQPPMDMSYQDDALRRLQMEQQIEQLESMRREQRNKMRIEELAIGAEQERLARARAERDATASKAEEVRRIAEREAALSKEKIEAEAKREAMEREVANRMEALEKKIATIPTAPPGPSAAIAAPAAPTVEIQSSASTPIHAYSLSEMEDAMWANALNY